MVLHLSALQGLYYSAIVAVLLSWFLWWRCKRTPEAQATAMTLVALMLLSASLTQHVALIIDQNVLHHTVQHFSSQFGIFVAENSVLCMAAIVASILTLRRDGSPFIAALVVASSVVLLVFWAITQII
jgi:uncharacterized membrane protein